MCELLVCLSYVSGHGSSHIDGFGGVYGGYRVGQ